MKVKEIAIISEIIKRKKPQYICEWGSGHSTVYFPKLLTKQASWIAIEHNRQWYEKTKQMIELPNTMIYHVPPNREPWTDAYNEGAYSDLKDYIEFPKKLNMIFDVIIIDGQARKDCLLIAPYILEKDGIVILHNANREYYHEPFKLYKHQVLFRATGVNSGLWIGSINLDLSTVLDIKKHEKIWEMLSKLRAIKNWFI